MKLLAIFLVCFFAEVFSQQMADYFARLETVKRDCISESSVRPDLVERLLQAEEFNEDNNLKCFMKCVLVKTNTMSAGGDIQADIWKSQFSPDIDQTVVNIAVEKCKDQTGVNDCDTAYNVVKCTVETFKMN